MEMCDKNELGERGQDFDMSGDKTIWSLKSCYSTKHVYCYIYCLNSSNKSSFPNCAAIIMSDRLSSTCGRSMSAEMPPYGPESSPIWFIDNELLPVLILDDADKFVVLCFELWTWRWTFVATFEARTFELALLFNRCCCLRISNASLSHQERL